MPTNQPTGQDSQMPFTPSQRENSMASTTRRNRSERVVAIKRPIMPQPRIRPSEVSLKASSR